MKYFLIYSQGFVYFYGFSRIGRFYAIFDASVFNTRIMKKYEGNKLGDDFYENNS